MQTLWTVLIHSNNDINVNLLSFLLTSRKILHFTFFYGPFSKVKNRLVDIDNIHPIS